MSITLTITGNKSILESHFQPPLSLEEKCECGLLYFSALNSIPNVTARNNVFAYGENNKQIHIPVGTYDLYDIVEYLETHISGCDIKIKPNNNTLKCFFYCSEIVDFSMKNSIGQLLGFQNVKLEANKWYESVTPVSILPLAVIRIECDLVQGSYSNGVPSHIIHEFVPNVPPGHRYIEIPKNIIYLPVNTNNISSLSVRVLDEHGNYIDFRGESIQLRLHLRSAT